MASCDFEVSESSHLHHIVPRYRGGKNDKGNLVEVSATKHAMWHYCNYRLWGDFRDKSAWKTLVASASVSFLNSGTCSKPLDWFHKDHGIVRQVTTSRMVILYDLRRRDLCKVASGKRKSHRGWSLYTNPVESIGTVGFEPTTNRLEGGYSIRTELRAQVKS